MYGYETESSSQSFNATINVNDEVITLPEPVPYDESPTWRTRVTLTTRHADASTTVHRNILALFSGEDLYSNLVQLWKELKKQYNAVLQKLLTLEDSNQLVFEMHMFSQRGHESYRREISDGRFSRILLLLFQEMSDGKIDSSETSFDVKSDIDERFTDPTPPSSPASSIRSIGELSLESFTSFSESIAFGGFSGDPYGTVQIFPESHPGTPRGSPTSTLAAESIVMVEAEAQTNAVIPETVGPLPLFTTNTHSSSSKVSEGTQRVYLSDSSSSVSLSTGRSSTERRRQSDDHVTNINQSRPTGRSSTERQRQSDHLVTNINQSQLQQIKQQLEMSLTRRLTDVKNTQEKDKMEIVRRIVKLEKTIKQSQDTAELMQASQKYGIDEGFSQSRGSLQDLSHKMDDMERLFEEKIQEVTVVRATRQESEKIQDLVYEVKDFRKDFDKFHDETKEKLDSVEKTMSEVKNLLIQISKPLPNPSPSALKSESHVHLQSSHLSTEPQTSTRSLPFSNTHLSSSNVSEGAQRVDLSESSSSVSLSTGRSSTERRRQSDDHVTNINQSRPIKLSDLKDVQAEIPPTFTPRTESPVQPPELEAALKMAEQEGFLSDSDNSLGDKSDGFHDDLPGATGFTDEHMHGNGNTVPLLPPGTIPVSFEDTRSEQDEQAIITEIQLNLQPGEEILLEANELRKLNGLPLTTDVLTVLVRALEGSKASGLQGIAQGGIDTVLCLDLSASTEGKAVEQMKSVLMEFLSDAEALSVNRNLSENIGIVVFGVETEIRAQLNIDYSELLDKICNLQVGGTSPLHTALVLCGIALKENGGPMSLGGYIVPPRIVVFTDGRPTADSQMNNPATEHGTKPSEIGERVKATVHQLHHQGFTLFTVPVGNHINRMFLQDIASIGGGKMVNLEDFRFIKKYFNYQVVAGTVIQRCHETGNRKNYAEFIAGEINQPESGLDEDDTMNITEIIHTSRELEDEEHNSLPALGSRVQVLSEEASLQPLQFGTVVQNLPDGWIKVQLDDGLIHFYHYSNSDQEEVKLVNTPRQLQNDQLIEVGVFVCSKEEPNKTGIVFRVTNSGYVDVRWENGTKSRHKYGADGEFTVDIQYDSKCPEDSWKWEDFETQQWVTFDPQNQLKIEQAFQKKEKTCLIDMDTDRVRIVFDRGHMKYIGKDIVISVKRFENT